MSNRSPLASTPAAIVVTVLSVFVVGYALFVVQQILLGLIAVGTLVTLYVLLRALVAFETIADALQRVAREMERE